MMMGVLVRMVVVEAPETRAAGVIAAAPAGVLGQAPAAVATAPARRVRPDKGEIRYSVFYGKPGERESEIVKRILKAVELWKKNSTRVMKE